MSRRSLLLAAVLALVTAACTSAQGVGTADPPTSSGPAALALVATDAGLAGVPVGSSTPRWVVPGAVAAPDGSAIFATRAVDGGVEVVRIDPRDGGASVVGRPTSARADLVVAAVAPEGELVALAAASDGATEVAVLDPATGTTRANPTFEGRLEPEAFSVSRTLLFAARIYERNYHVHALDLAAAAQYPTLGPDKTVAPEDMVGSAVQSVLSPDRTQLATLYLDAATPGRTAFVHLLSLETATTVCIDLAPPFGTGERGTDAIEWRADATVVVGHRGADPAASMAATFSPAAIWSAPPQRHHHADVRADPDPPTLPAGVRSTPGFERFVALVP